MPSKVSLIFGPSNVTSSRLHGMQGRYKTQLLKANSEPSIKRTRSVYNCSVLEFRWGVASRRRFSRTSPIPLSRRSIFCARCLQLSRDLFNERGGGRDGNKKCAEYVFPPATPREGERNPYSMFETRDRIFKACLQHLQTVIQP